MTAPPSHADAPQGKRLADVARLLLLTGKVLLQSGAATSRSEETLMRMGLACGLDSVNVFCTLTGFFVTLVSGDEVVTRLLTVKRHGIDLGLVAAVNDLSRQLEAGDLSLDDALARARCLVVQGPGYSLLVRTLTRGLSSASFALLMGGTWNDFIPAMLAGIFAQIVHDRVLRYGPEFVAIFFAAMIGTLWSILATHIHMAAHFRFVVIGMMMPLVPGMALTSGIRDLISGDLLSGTSRAVDAGLSAAAIAGGVYTILIWFKFNLWI